MKPVQITDASQITDPAFIERLNASLAESSHGSPGAKITFTTETAATIMPIKHNLGRLPGRFAISEQNGTCTFSSDSTGATAGTKAWDSEYIYVVPSAAGVVVTVNVW